MKRVFLIKATIIFMKWNWRVSLFRFKLYCIGMLVMMSVISCSFLEKNEDTEITLQWNQSYPEETIEDAIIGLKWSLSFMGSDAGKKSSWSGLDEKENRITLSLDKLYFTDSAVTYLSKLHAQLKQTEEYKKTGAIDLGRYMALTIGSPNHYYKIAAVPQHLEQFKVSYTFDTIYGYVNNSGVSKVHRLISYAQNMSGSRQAYISTEIDSITREPLEFETVEVMPNGLSRFGLYDLDGNLKEAGDAQVTRAGKVAKCMWCHESGIQPMFRIQLEVPGYLTYQGLQDTLTKYGLAIREYQNEHWEDKSLKKRPNHTKMEIAYIAFMEPSLTHLSNEWQLSKNEVKNLLGTLPTHRHEEFDFLGDLYHRAAVDSLAPWKVQKVPNSIREKDGNELELL